MKYKLNGDYLQVWTDDRKYCVSLGKANKLVSNIIIVDQTKKLRDKLTKISLWEKVAVNQT